MANENITDLIFKVIGEFQFYEKAKFDDKNQSYQIKITKSKLTNQTKQVYIK